MLEVYITDYFKAGHFIYIHLIDYIREAAKIVKGLATKKKITFFDAPKKYPPQKCGH